MPDAAPPDLRLTQGRLTAEITLRPFSFTIRRDGRRLLRNASAWIAEGTSNDHFVQWTEGVVAEEQLTLLERVARARPPTDPEVAGAAAVSSAPGAPAPSAPGSVSRASGPFHEGATETARLRAGVRGGAARGELLIAMHPDMRIVLSLSAGGEPLRLAFDWDRRSNEHFVGLGARHGTVFDQRGRSVQLGADRRYTGPDCPPEMITEGGIPTGGLRADAVDALQPRLQRAGPYRGQRHTL